MGAKARMPASASASFSSILFLATCIIVSDTINAQAHGSPVSGPQGSGNIGCTFSPAVCDPDQEFCYNDNAFGRCVPLYGMPDESNFYRYSLTKADAHALEEVIERLTADGYRWHHAFTQCTLQHVLNAIRYGWEGERRTQHDCSEARAADDLNSMVNALAAEGLDQGIDPLDLAFIKYRPGDTYSEDLYLPAAAHREQQRQSVRPSQVEEDARRKLDEEKQLEAELENYILGSQDPSRRNKLERNELEEELEANQRERGRPAQQQQEVEFIQPKIFSPIYNTPELLRQGIESRDELLFLPEDGDLTRDSNNNVPKTPAKLSPSGQEIIVPPKLEFFVDENDALLQEPNTIAKQINKLPVNQIARADAKLAKDLEEYDEVREALLEAAAREEMFENQQQQQKLAPAPAPFHRFSVPRKSGGEGGKMSMFAPENNDGTLFLSQNPGFEGRRHPVYLDTANNGDGEDYAQDDQDREAEFETAMLNGMVVDSHGGGPFERHERLDVKKPGPWYRSVNNFAFDDDDEDKQAQQLRRENKETGWDFPVNPEFRRAGPIGILLPEAAQQQQQQQQQHEASSQGEHEKSKNRENIESLLKLTERKTGGGGSTAGSLPKSSEIEALDIIDTSYINVLVGNRIGWNAARDLVNLLADLLDLKHSIFREVRVRDNVVTFKVEPNDKKLDAATIAHKIESFKSVVQKESDITIVKAEAGVRANPGSSASGGPAALPLFDDGLTRNNNLYIATFALCGVVAAVVVAAFTLYFVRRNARSKEKFTKLGQEDPSMEACSKDYQDLCRARMASKNNEKPESHRAVQRVQSNISRDSDAGGTSSSRSSTSSWTEEPVLTNMDISTGHMVLSYMEDHLNNKSRLDQEWTALCAYEADPCSTAIAEKPDNAKKNRYTNSLPYDHSRVVLNELANVSGCDYINASSITDHDPRNPAYIATQGPLQATCADFWQMVWEQGSVVIVTLTRLKDNGTTLCHRYWPEEGSELHHIYEVHLVSEHIWCDDYLVRSFYLKNLKTGETRTVTQFHFLAWPENGIPSSTKTLLEFRRKVNKSYRGRSCPIIVHCSDGAGRTGTYCLIDMVLNRMSKGAKEIDIAASLEHIRDQRAGMVRTKQQFEFVLMAVAEEVHAILKALPQ